MLKRGHSVKWKTAARGHRRVKEGKIFAIVPASTSPAEAVELAGRKVADVRARFELMFSHFDCWTRKDISYLVQVDENNTDTMPRLYWPRSTWLKKIEG